MSIHPSYEMSRQILRSVSDLKTFESIAQISKWHYSFYNSNEGQDIKTELQNTIALGLNNGFRGEYTFRRWMEIEDFKVRKTLKKIPPQICYLNNLVKLNLSYNYIEDIPIEICDLSYIKILALRHNLIKVVPPQISNLKSLRLLDLGFNPIKKLPDELCELTNLTYLDIYCDELKKLPSGLCKMTNLITLHMTVYLRKLLPHKVVEMIQSEKN